MKLKSMQSGKNKKGFTLVELITVVAIVSLLVVYITIRLSSSNEDAKVALASTFILGKVPTVISAYKARHMNSCAGLDADDDPATDDDIRTELISRGLVGTTPWDEEWAALYDHGERRIQIIFPLQGMEDPQISTDDIIENIYDAPQIDGLVAVVDTSSAGYTAIPDADSDGVPEVPGAVTVTRAGSLQIWYDCI